MDYNNISTVRKNIARKCSSNPYHATINQAGSIVTDYDNFPYNRWYRGKPTSSRPIIAEREAGWRPRHEQCYEVVEPECSQKKHSTYPNHCFETACSTVFPCYPEYLTKYADREALNLVLNKACVVQHR